MNKLVQKIRTIIIAVLLTTTVVFSAKAQAVGDKFKIDNLYYQITNLNPKEVAVAMQKDDYPYWDDSEKPTGDIVIPEQVNKDGVNYKVTSIGETAFAVCNGITSITMHDFIKRIDEYAFFYCESLTSININKSITSIGYSVFSNCSALTSINVASDNPNYISENGILFNKNKTKLIAYPDAKTGTKYIIPNSVTNIANDAFFSNISLESITIHDLVTNIGDAVFNQCKSLTAIYNRIEDLNKIQVGGYLFTNMDKSKCTLYVPTKAVDTYKQAAQWKELSKIIGVQVTLNTTTQNLDINETCTLTATIESDDFPNKNIIWSSSNTDIATVDNKGLVTAHEGGTTIIKASTEDGGFNATCEVKVASDGTGINDNNITFDLYPTLVETGFTVKTNKEYKVLYIYNLMGTIVTTVPLTQQEQFINVSNLPQGLYIAKIGTKTIKFIKH